MDETNQDHFESSKKKMDVLLSLGAGEELESSLNKLIGFQVQKYRTNIKQIRHELNRFETEYKMSSEVFFKKFEAGEIGDDADYFEWAALYENILLYSERIRTLEKTIRSQNDQSFSEGA
jgi:hypothetical protein